MRRSSPGTGPTASNPIPDRHIDWRPVDLLKPHQVAAAIEDATPAQIFHIAGAPQVASSFNSAVPHLQTNVLGTQHLLEAVRRAGRPCRILVVSSSQVYQVGDDPIHEGAPLVPSTPYGLSKLAQDRLADRAFAEDGLDIVIARPFNHAGPRQAPAFAVSSFARQVARIEAGLDAAGHAGGQPGRAPGHDRRARCGGRLQPDDGRRARRPAVQHLLGPRVEDGRPARRTAALGPCDDQSESGSVTPPAERRPRDSRRRLPHSQRARLEAEDSVEQMLSDTLEWWRGQLRRR